MHLADSRRYAHFGLLVLMIIGIRACGGANQAEDRLTSVARWTAERTGLSGVKDTLDSQIKPRLAEASGSMTYKIYAASADVMNGFESAVNGTAGWIWQQVLNAENAIEMVIRSTLSPEMPAKPQPPNAVPADKDPTKTPPPR